MHRESVAKERNSRGIVRESWNKQLESHPSWILGNFLLNDKRRDIFQGVPEVLLEKCAFGWQAAV